MRRIEDDEGDYIGRSCEGCIFLMQSEDLECATGRLQSFVEREEVIDVKTEEYEGPCITRFCNMFRDEDWSNLKNLDSMDDEIMEARKEVSCKFAIALRVENSEDTTIEDVRERVDDLIKMGENYDKNKMYVVLSAYMGWHTREMVHWANVLTQNGIKTAFVAHSDQKSTTQSQDYDIMSKCIGCTHIITSNCKEAFALHYLNEFDRILNDDLDMVLGIRSDDIACVSFNTINVNYKKYNNYDEMIEGIWEEYEDSGMFVKI